MASMLSFLRRPQPATRKQRSQRLLLELLEDRLSPAANLLVSTTLAGSEQVVREFDQAAQPVRTVLLPAISGFYEAGRDLVYDPSGKVHVYAGTNEPTLATYNLSAGGWSQRTHPGWSTVNNTTYGGIGQLGNYVYVTDMSTFTGPGDEAKGVVRFNLADGTSARFLTSESPVDLTVGKDGRLYLLSGNTVKSYDPNTFALQSTVALPAGDFRSLAVNAAGQIFAVNMSEQVYRLSASGAVLGSMTLTGVADPMDIDLSGDGRVAVGTVSGHVVQMNESLTGITTFSTGGNRAFVAFGPDETQSPAGPALPTASISSDIVQAEGNSGTTAVVFTVTLSSMSVDPVAFKFTTVNGTATSGSDYGYNAGTRVLLTGQTSTQISVNLIGDTTFEADEHFTLQLTDPVGVTLVDDSTKTTITNDDPFTPYFIVDDVSQSEGQSGNTVYSFLVKLSTPSAQTVTVEYTTRDDSATAGSDYTARSGTVTFNPGQMQQVVEVMVQGDLAVEEDEAFFLELSNATNADITDAQMVGTIFNDDMIHQLSVGDVHVMEGNSGGGGGGGAEAVFTVTLNQASGATILVDYYTLSGDATTYGDFAYTSGTLTFDPGQTSNTITVPIYGDGEVEPDEVFYVVLSYPTGASLADDLGAGTIVNDDVPTPPVVQADSYDLGEDQTFDSTYAYPGYSVLSNDYATNGYYLTASLVSGPAHGTLNLNASGTFTYTPAPNYNGPDSFVYRATDSLGLSAEATVSLTVWPMDDPIQLASPGPQTVAEDASLTFSTANGNALTIADLESPRVLVYLMVNDGILSLPSTAGLESPYPESVNNSPTIAFYADDPAEANAALNGLVFTPNPNFSGPVYFGVYALDTTIVSYPVDAFTSVSIAVTPVNDAPVAVDDAYAVEAGVPFVATLGGGGNGLGVLMNDQDVDWDMLTATLVSSPTHGTLTFNPDGTFTYTADAGYSGIDTFTYQASDGLFQSGLAKATFTVTLNLPPVSVADAYAVNEDGSLSVPAAGVLGNDSDPEGQPLTAQLVSGAAHGVLTLNPNGSFTYIPTANYHGPDEFWYRASDGKYLGDAVAVTLTVNPVNDVPVASNDSYSVDEDVVLTIATAGVLGNDADAEGNSLSAVLVSGPSHGVVTLNPDGSFSYTPNANYNGDDSFTYKANDGQADSNVASVNITVNAINDAPVAVDDAYSVNEDQTLTIAPTPGVTSLIMVSQPGDYIGQGLSYSFTPQTGTFMTNRNFDNGVSVFYSGGGQSWNLQFAAPFDANLTPSYYANATRWPFQASNVPGMNISGNGRGSNTLTGNFTVTQALYAADGSVLRFAASFEQHSEGAAPALTGEIKINQGNAPSGLFLNDSDAEGSPLTLIIVSNPAHGTLAMNVDGSFKYTPFANYNGPDSFTYKISDGTFESNVATVSLTVNSVNDFPTANNDSYTVAEDSVLTVEAPGVLANDSDIDGDSLTANLVTSPTRGNLTFNANGSFSYTPQANYHGSDSFKYAAYDGTSLSFIRTVTLTITSVNDAPTAGNDSYTTAEDTPLTVAAAGVLANDADVEGTALTALVVSGPTHGTLTLSGNGSFTYTPNANYNGPDSFSYKANDASADSNVATVSLTISAVNDAPTAADDAYTVAEDQALTIPAPGVLGNDTDVDGNSLSMVLVSGPVHGTLNWNADGSFSYTPDANYHGGDSFTYKANDGSLDSNIAVVMLAITPVNDVPLVSAGSDQTVNEGSIVSFTSTASDADGDPLSYLWNFGDGSTATSAAPTHLFADNGTYTVTLTVTDGQGGVTHDSLIVTVLNVVPTLTLSGASAVNEASTYTLNLAATDPGQDSIANWTITWGDGSVQFVPGNPGSVSHTYADGTQSYTITATATDEDGTHTAGNSVSVTVNNVAPTASIGGPATGVRGQVRTFTFDAVDASAIDQAGSFTFTINWGDGNSQPTTGPASQQLEHIYTTAGTYTVQITARDKDGGTSAIVQKTITISAVDVQAGTLVIGGTTANDTINVTPANTTGSLVVTINGVSQGTFAPPTQIVIYGQAGGDQIKLLTKKFGPTTYYVMAPAALFGDAGNDTLDARGSKANNILVGGDGTDALQGGLGRDLLIGGDGADTLHGNGGDDLVIGNATNYDTNLEALNALMAEWGRTDADYTTRVNHLSGNAGGGLNGGYVLNNTTVQDDADIDQLFGETGSDWFLYTSLGSNKDKLNDVVMGEIATAL